MVDPRHRVDGTLGRHVVADAPVEAPHFTVKRGLVVVATRHAEHRLGHA